LKNNNSIREHHIFSPKLNGSNNERNKRNKRSVDIANIRNNNQLAGLDSNKINLSFNSNLSYESKIPMINYARTLKLINLQSSIFDAKQQIFDVKLKPISFDKTNNFCSRNINNNFHNFTYTVDVVDNTKKKSLKASNNEMINIKKNFKERNVQTNHSTNYFSKDPSKETFFKSNATYY